MAKVLLIEDDPLMLRMYQKVLSFEGYEVLLALGGDEGVKKARIELPNLILLDIMMPKMNGIEVLEELKSYPETKKIPIIILTNLAEDSVINKAFSLGAAGYLIKSEVSNDRIIEEVKQYIKE